MTWRDKFRPIIAEVLKAHAGETDAEIRRALRAAWSEKRAQGSWPYKVWLEEIAAQRGQRTRPRKKVQRMTAKEAREWMSKKQMPLFP